MHAGDEILVSTEELDDACLYAGLGTEQNPRQFLTVITKCENDECTELIRARTTWV